eukprot:2115629-Amphidinium_carterae.1
MVPFAARYLPEVLQEAAHVREDAQAVIAASFNLNQCYICLSKEAPIGMISILPKQGRMFAAQM